MDPPFLTLQEVRALMPRTGIVEERTFQRILLQVHEVIRGHARAGHNECAFSLQSYLDDGTIDRTDPTLVQAILLRLQQSLQKGGLGVTVVAEERMLIIGWYVPNSYEQRVAELQQFLQALPQTRPTGTAEPRNSMN